MSETKPGKVVHVLGPHEFDRYVGRAVPRKGLKASPLMNQYRIGKDGDRAGVLAQYREFVNRVASVAALEEYMPGATGWGKEAMRYLALIEECAGQTLACWCSEPRDAVLTKDDPIRCHAQIILKFAEDGVIPYVEAMA